MADADERMNALFAWLRANPPAHPYEPFRDSDYLTPKNAMDTLDHWALLAEYCREYLERER